MSQIRTTATLLAIAIAGGLFFFQNCAQQPVSSRKAKSQTNCNVSGTCYEEEDDGGPVPTTTTSTVRASTTTSSPGTTTTTSTGGSTARAEVLSVSLIQNGQSIPIGGYYSQSSSLFIVVTGRNITSVRWGPDLTFNCIQSGPDSNCTSTTVTPGGVPSGLWSSISVQALNGANTALSQTLIVASQCHALLGECRLVLQADNLSQGFNANEVIYRGRSLGVFIASSLTTEQACNASRTTEQANALPAVSTFNRSNPSECIFFRAAMPSGTSSDYQCFYVGIAEPAPAAIYYNNTHEVPCNQGRTLQQMGEVTSDMNPLQAYAHYIVRHRATNLADVASVYANCSNGSCQISSVKAGHRKATCTSSMCSFP